MDWEVIILATIAIVSWGILLIGKTGAIDTTVHRGEKDWYDRYYGKEDKKWGR